MYNISPNLLLRLYRACQKSAWSYKYIGKPEDNHSYFQNLYHLDSYPEVL